MSVPYQNPISSVQLSQPYSVSRTSVFGTHFSVLNVGGYMEVYNLSDLSLTLTSSTYPSLIQLSANTIPIRFTKGDGTFLSPDYITLNSDNISSGRRRLGMMVYVHETDKVYQYVIPNYDTLWNNITGLTGFSAVTYSDYTTVINNRSSAGQSFINAWTASTIEGVSGYTSTDSNWRIFQTGGGSIFTGGTVTGPTIFTNGLTANTISATTYYNLPKDIYVTGGTYSSGTATFTNNSGGTFSISGFSIPQLSAVTIDTYSGTRLYPYDPSINGFGVSRSVNGAVGINVQNPNAGNGAYAALSVGGTNNFYEGSSLIYYGSGYYRTELRNTAGIYNDVPFKFVGLNNSNIEFKTGNAFGSETTKFSISSGGTINIGILPSVDSSDDILVRNSSGDILRTSKSGITSGFLPLTGGTLTGGLTANTISASTYYNLPSFTGAYLPLSGGTVYGPTIFSSGLTANTLNVTGLTQTKGLTSTSGIIFPQLTINSTYTATTDDYLIDVTGGTFNVQLQSAVGIQGRLLVVKNNGGGAVTVYPTSGQTIDDKPYLILSETNSIQLASNGTNWVILGQDRSTVNNSTGVFSFTGLSKVSSTQFYVAPVKGWIVDDTTNPLSPQILYVNFTGGTYTDSYVSLSNETFVYLTSGGTIAQKSTILTEQERRQNIFLGKLGHPDKTTINLVFSQPDFVLSPLAQLRDVFQPINLINGGVYPSYNTGLTFNTSFGYLYGLGINFVSSTLNPNNLTIPATNPCTFQYRTQTGGSITNIVNIDPLNYDVGGVITPITGTKATNQRIYLLQNGTFRVQYGQTSYNNFADAVQALQTESFTIFPNFTNNAVLIGILTVLSTATDLSDPSKAQFFFASKFGETIGAAGGVSTTNLQQAYNNSTSPEIIINSTLDGLSIKNGTGNADNITNLFEGQNSGGTVTSFIRADGGFSGLSISATTYYGLPTDVRVTGGTYSSGSLTFTNNTGGTFNVTGLYTGGTDVFVTGGTYSNGTTTFTNNTGGTFNVTGFSTGYTLNKTDINNTLGYIPYRYINTTSTVISTAVETAVATATISGSIFNSNDIMKMLFRCTKGVTTNNVTMRIRINTSNTLTGATQIATYTFVTTSAIALVQRHFTLSGGSLYGFGFTSSQITDILGISTGGNNTSYNTANTLYVFFTVQPGSGDSVTFEMANITN
jgi:hypothetical protein